MTAKPSKSADEDVEETSVTFHCLFQNAQELRRDNLLCDTRLKSDDGTIVSAHAVLLASRVPYFYDLLVTGRSEEHMNEETITIKHIEGSTLEALIDFVYTGSLRIDAISVRSLLRWASIFKMEKALKLCCEFVNKNLTAHSLQDWLAYAITLECSMLLRSGKIDTYIRHRFVDFSKSELFLELGKDEVLKLMSCSDLNVESEEVVFTAASNWVKHDEKKRSMLMHQLLHEIRLPLLSKQFLTHVVEKDPNCKSCPTCQDLIEQTKDFHLNPNQRTKFSNRQVTTRFCSDMPSFMYGYKYNRGPGLSVWKFSLVDKSWERVVDRIPYSEVLNTPLPHYEHYIVGLNGRMYFFLDLFNNDLNRKENKLIVYTVASRQWDNVTPMTVRRGCYFRSCGLQNRLYVCGGTDGLGGTLKSCEVFDPDTCEWSPIPDMSGPRCSHAVVAFEGCLWVLGGNTLFGWQERNLRSVEFYDPYAERWTMSTPMLKNRHQHGAAATGGKIFVFGGEEFTRVTSLVYHDSCEQFDRLTRQFSFIQSMMSPRYDMACATVGDNSIYCLGGWCESARLLRDCSAAERVEVYKVKENEWTDAAEMPGFPWLKACNGPFILPE